MIKLEGKIAKVFDAQKKTDKFTKRLFWLEDVSERFPNMWKMELWNADCTLIDNYKIGDFVTAYIDVRGKKWSKSDGTEDVENTLKCWNFEKEGVILKKID